MCSSVSGTVITAGAAILFALIDPSVTYWAFGFPSTLFIVFGADFVYSAGTIFLAKAANPGEHSVVGALFQTMTQVGVSRHNMLCVKSSHITYYRPRGKKILFDITLQSSLYLHCCGSQRWNETDRLCVWPDHYHDRVQRRCQL